MRLQTALAGIPEKKEGREELMEAVIKSDHSYAEILAFIKGEAEVE